MAVYRVPEGVGPYRIKSTPRGEYVIRNERTGINRVKIVLADRDTATGLLRRLNAGEHGDVEIGDAST
jgi:hypothetical protein